MSNEKSFLGNICHFLTVNTIFLSDIYQDTSLNFH